MKKPAIVGAALGLLVTLVGCGGDSSSDPTTSTRFWVDTGDGRSVYCIAIGHGMSCDWAGSVDHP